MKIIGLSIYLLFVTLTLAAQTGVKKSEYPEIGKPMPFFEFSDLKGYPGAKFNLSGNRGKWVILDWWTKYCMSCIESFPKTDAFQKKFKDKVQFLYVSYTGSWTNNGVPDPGDKSVRSIYARANAFYHFSVPFAFDSLYYQRFNLGTTPYIVVIDPDGIVRAITYHLKEQDIQDLIDGRSVRLLKAYRMDEPKPKYNNSLPFLTYENGGPDTAFIYRSILASWSPGDASYLPYRISAAHRTGRLDEIGITMEGLYELGYLGKFNWSFDDSLYDKVAPKPILEMENKASFTPDYVTGANIYSYSLTVPVEKSTTNFLMEWIQADLSKYFPYTAHIETRKVPVWKLVASPQAIQQLRTKGGPRNGRGEKGQGFALQNAPFSIVVTNIRASLQQEDPVIDDTGIEGNVDIAISAVMNNVESLKTALKSLGLDLVRGEKDMKVIVIRDASQQ